MTIVINPGSGDVEAQGNGWTNTYEQACLNAEAWFDAMREEGFVDIEMTPTGKGRGGRWLFTFRHTVTGTSVDLNIHGIDDIDAYVREHFFYPRVYWNGWSDDPVLGDFAAEGFEPVTTQTYRRLNEEPLPLRDAVAEAIDGVARVEMVTAGYESCWLDNPGQCADAAIAAMVTALLSETAVEAAIDAERSWHALRVSSRGVPATRENMRSKHGNSMFAALEAIGATTDCGCTVTDAVEGETK